VNRLSQNGSRSDACARASIRGHVDGNVATSGNFRLDPRIANGPVKDIDSVVCFRASVDHTGTTKADGRIALSIATTDNRHLIACRNCAADRPACRDDLKPVGCAATEQGHVSCDNASWDICCE
jgi:hypothetical protein